MEPNIRPARADDQTAIAAFTTDTFEWGDYIADVFADWLGDDGSCILVATDKADAAMAVGRGLMLSPTELWLQGMRVHPDWRRKGVGSAVALALIDWARRNGAVVARLGVEDWNAAARHQVEDIGFRPVGDWVVAVRPIPTGEPVTPTNGGKRAQARRKLKRAHSAEAMPAWLSWRSGPLLRPTRGLQSWRWRWSRLDLEYLTAAAKRGELWSSQAGWAMARRDEERLSVGWLECGPDDAADMMRSLVDLSGESGAERIHLTVPTVDWLLTALEAAHFESVHPMVVYEMGL